jgi:hypothetical protein
MKRVLVTVVLKRDDENMRSNHMDDGSKMQKRKVV